MNLSNLFQNRKQKIVWLLYLLWLTYGLGNFNCSTNASHCILANWNIFFKGILIAIVFKTLVAVVAVSLLKGKEKQK